MVEKLKQELAKRPDLLAIYKIIPHNTRVIDLGCGNGTFLRLLKKEKDAKCLGIELSQESIIECIDNGVPVIHSDLDEGLKFVNNNSFDFVVLSETLQAVHRPDLLINEMLRVGKQGIISFINFGYLPSRIQLLLGGTMPETKTLPNPWYNTPNIHLATIIDFRNLCHMLGVRIVKEIPLGRGDHSFAKAMPNLFASCCVFVIAKL
ncbi:MAG: methionine biosynthesis protein MetW [Victivallaceae bacterium]|jgi:methionine biosynthesis protein MetW